MFSGQPRGMSGSTSECCQPRSLWGLLTLGAAHPVAAWHWLLACSAGLVLCRGAAVNGRRPPRQGWTCPQWLLEHGLSWTQPCFRCASCSSSGSHRRAARSPWAPTEPGATLRTSWNRSSTAPRRQALPWLFLLVVWFEREREADPESSSSPPDAAVGSPGPNPAVVSQGTHWREAGIGRGSRTPVEKGACSPRGEGLPVASFPWDGNRLPCPGCPLRG